MPIDRDPTHSHDSTVVFVLKNSGDLYTHDQVRDLLDQALARGIDFDSGSLDGFTVAELDRMLNGVERFAN